MKKIQPSIILIFPESDQQVKIGVYRGARKLINTMLKSIPMSQLFEFDKRDVKNDHCLSKIIGMSSGDASLKK